MIQNNFRFNNEAIASISIGYFLRLHGSIEITKLMFILPFVLHEPTVKRLRNQSFKRSLDEFILKNPDVVLGFNARYFAFLPLAINSLTMLTEMGVIIIDKDIINFNYRSRFDPENATVGSRAVQLFGAIDNLNQLMIHETSSSFYQKLKITL